MHYGAIKNCDIANGPGVRVTLFVSGCRRHCPGCFQPETWSFQYGTPFTEETAEQILELLKPDFVQGLTILGGEPFEPENQRSVVKLLRLVRERLPEKDIWCFSGYEYDVDLAPGGQAYTEVTDEIFSLIDTLVDGPFREEEKDITLRFRGSRNQRIVDRETLMSR